MTRNQFIKLFLASIGMLSTHRILSQEDRKKKEVIIIGAGIAGLAAGRKLHTKGYQVTILEARNRVGGRIWTDNSMGLQAEMGASIIHGISENPIRKLTEQLKLHVVSLNLEDSEIYDAKEKKLSEEDLLKVEGYYKDFITKLYSMKEGASKNESIEYAKKSIFSNLSLSESEKSCLEWMIGTEIENKLGADLQSLSLKYFDEAESLTGHDVILSDGFSEIPKNLARGLNIKISHVVSKIEYDKKIKVSTDRGEFTSDYAIVTVPLGVLKKKKIHFIPELPEKKHNAIQNLGFGIVNKIFLKFPKKFWSSEVHRFGITFKSSSERIEFWDLNPLKNTPMLTGLVSGEKAISLEKENKKEIVKESTEILKQIYGNKIPSLLEENHSRWKLDPFSFGTGSYLAINSEPEDYKIMAESVNDLLFFAGEATNSIYPSTVHGAYLSGEREADRIIQLVEG